MDEAQRIHEAFKKWFEENYGELNSANKDTWDSLREAFVEGWASAINEVEKDFKDKGIID